MGKKGTEISKTQPGFEKVCKLQKKIQSNNYNIRYTVKIILTIYWALSIYQYLLCLITPL